MGWVAFFLSICSFVFTENQMACFGLGEWGWHFVLFVVAFKKQV